MLNTDPFGAPATVPVHWLEGDFQGAVDNPTVKHIFVVGHKPAFTPPIAALSNSLDSFPAARDVFWDELNAANFDAYFVALAHVYFQSQPSSGDEPNVQQAWQIVAGNAGSKLDAKWAASGALPYFGYTLVNVTQSGHVLIENFGRDFYQTNYLALSPPDVYPTTLRSLTDIRLTQ